MVQLYERLSGEFLADASSKGPQDSPPLEALADRGAVGAAPNLARQVIPEAGYVGGVEFLVNTTTMNDQSRPQSARLANGNIIVTWSESDPQTPWPGIYLQKAQLYDGNGAPIGDEFAIDGTRIVALVGGGFVTTFIRADTSNGTAEIVTQVYDDNGQRIGDQIFVDDTTPWNQVDLSITALSGGGFAIAWDDYGAGWYNPDIRVQRFDASGAKVGGAEQLNSSQVAPPSGVEIAGLVDGGFVATWIDDGALEAMIFDAGGTRAGSAFAVTDDPSVIEPRVTALPSGGFVVAWEHVNAFFGVRFMDHLALQVFDSSGSKIGSEILVDPTAPGEFESVDLTALDDGGFVLTWAAREGSSDYATDIVGQVFDPAGARVGGPFTANMTVAGAQIDSNVVALDNGRFLVSWTDQSRTGADTDGMAVRARILGPDTSPGQPAPQGTDSHVTMVEDEPHSFTMADFGFIDPTGDGFAGIVVATAPEFGWLTLNGYTVGVGKFVTAAQIAAGAFAFQPGSEENGFDYTSFTFQVRNNSGGTDLTANTIIFDISPVNDAPSFWGFRNDYGGAFIEDGGPALLDEYGITQVYDWDSTDFAGGYLRVSITNGIPAEDMLGVGSRANVSVSGSTAGSTISVDGIVIGTIAPGASGAPGEDLVINFNDAANADRVGALTRALIYWNTNTDAPDETQRNFAVTINDGDGPQLGTSNQVLRVFAVNDAPSLAAPTESLVHSQVGTAATSIFGGVTISDPDGPNAWGGTLRITGGNDGSSFVLTGSRFSDAFGSLYDTETGLWIGSVWSSQGELTVSLNQNASLATINALARSFGIVTTPDATTGVATITLAYSDNQQLPANSVKQLVSVESPSSATRPLVDLNGDGYGLSATISYTENGPGVALGTEIRIMAPSGGNPIDGMKVVMHHEGSGDLVTHGALPPGISVATSSDASTTTWVFSGTAGSETYLQLLSGIRYANSREGPAFGDREVRWFEISLESQGVASETASAFVTLNWVDDRADARDDVFTTFRNVFLTGNVFADNGFGADTDVDNALYVSGINRAGRSPYEEQLPSGALLLMNSDGSFRYNPNGAFTGPATDSFTYALHDGETATVTIDIVAGGPDGGTSGNDILNGTSGDDSLDGLGGNDIFYLQQGGSDDAAGGGDNDGFYFGPAFDYWDRVDGGPGTDTLVVQGDYDHLVLAGITNIEVLLVASGSDTRFGDTAGNDYQYTIYPLDLSVAYGATFSVNATGLKPGESLTFDGWAEADGHFRIFAGQGIDVLNGGAGNDGFFFGADGNLTATDRISGAAGTDSIALRGNYTLAFEAESFTGVEILTFLSGHTNEYGGPLAAGGFDYDVTIADGNVAAGSLLQVIGVNLRADESLRFDGRAEALGSLRILSGAGDDTLFGGSGGDTLYGALGADQLDGGAGADLYLYRTAQDSTAASRDTIAFGAGDKIDLSLIDANSGTAANEAFAFVGAAAFSNAAGELRAYQSGASWLVEGDVNGDGTADFVLAVTASTPIVANDFVL